MKEPLILLSLLLDLFYLIKHPPTHQFFNNYLIDFHALLFLYFVILILSNFLISKLLNIFLSSSIEYSSL